MVFIKRYLEELRKKDSKKQHKSLLIISFSLSLFFALIYFIFFNRTFLRYGGQNEKNLQKSFFNSFLNIFKNDKEKIKEIKDTYKNIYDDVNKVKENLKEVKDEKDLEGILKN